MSIQLAEIVNVVTINQPFNTGIIYQVTLINNIICTVPDDEDNADYGAVQQWLAQHS